MSDFGSGIERYGPRFELSGRASKADLRRRIAALEAENDKALGLLRLAMQRECEWKTTDGEFRQWLADLHRGKNP